MVFFVVCCRNEGESTDAGKDDGDSKSDKTQIFWKQIQLWKVAACDVSSSHLSMPTSVSVKRCNYINYKILFYIEMLAWRTCIVIYSYPKNPHSIRISSEDHRQFDIKFNELILHVLGTQHLTITHFQMLQQRNPCQLMKIALNVTGESVLWMGHSVSHFIIIHRVHCIIIYRSYCIMIYKLYTESWYTNHIVLWYMNYTATWYTEHTVS